MPDPDLKSIDIKTVSGKQLAQYIPAIAELRIEVFREFPYLYDGSIRYEQGYLQTYLDSSGAVVVLAFDGERIVGASTGLPMADESEAFKAPFIARGLDPRQIFYCGESVLLAEYRGLGLYKHFFSERENHARQLGGFTLICFCAVIRDDEHPARPATYQPLDDIWQHFGYRKEPGLSCQFPWREIGQTEESQHAMQFWVKEV